MEAGLTEYDCRTLPHRNRQSSPRLRIDELDVIDSDMGMGTQHTHNRVWDIKTLNSGAGYTVQSAYDGNALEGLPFSPPSCNHLVSLTDASGISYGYPMVTSTRSASQPSYLTDNFISFR